MENMYGESGTLQRLIWRDFHKTKEWPKCFYCQREFTHNMDGYQNMSVDHLKSQKDGGADEIDNLVISCKSCNSSKGATSFSKNDEALKEFKIYRSNCKQADDKWVSNHLIQFSQMETETYPNFNQLKNELFDLMQKKSDVFFDVKFYRDKDIEFKSIDNQLWYFRPENYALQPYNTWQKIGKNLLTEEDSALLCRNGYMLNYYASKMIKPFSKASDGIETIKEEINHFSEILKKLSITIS